MIASKKERRDTECKGESVCHAIEPYDIAIKQSITKTVVAEER